MNDNRLTKRIFDIVNNSVRKTNWLHEIEDLKQAGISKDEIGKEENSEIKLKTQNLK